MARNKYNEEFKIRIIRDYLKGLSQKSISEKYSIEKSVISRIIKRYRERGTISVSHCGGRPRKTTKYDDDRIVIKFKKEPFATARMVRNELNLNVSKWTIQRRANEAGLKCRTPAKKPFISDKNRKLRLKFAKEHINWSVQKWKTVLFSDESKFNLKKNDGKQKVRRPKRKRFDPKYTLPTTKHGGGNVMVWGCFSGFGTGPITRITEIMTKIHYKEIVEDVMYPYAEENMPLSWYYQHDNDPKHKAKIIGEWFKDNNVLVLEWPPQSPDLNPIENLWEIVDKRIRNVEYENLDQLYQAIEREWHSIPTFVIENLIKSMPKRCYEVIRNNGYSTKY